MSLEVGSCQEQGHRPYQEDEIVIAPGLDGEDCSEDTHLFSIFDGHAGGRCSKYLSAQMANALQESNSYEKCLKSAFLDAYRITNARFLVIAERSNLSDGSTGLCCALRRGKLVIANVGDCRAVMVSSRRAEALTRDQKPSSKIEASRILALGGSVVNCLGVPRVNGVLAVSRAFGNRQLRHVIRPDPEITERSLSMDDQYLVLASDGVWDVLTEKDVLGVCWQPRGKSSQQIAKDIIQLALASGSQDNVSCIVIGLADYIASLPHKAQPSSSSPSKAVAVVTPSSSPSENEFDRRMLRIEFASKQHHLSPHLRSPLRSPGYAQFKRETSGMDLEVAGSMLRPTLSRCQSAVVRPRKPPSFLAKQRLSF